MNAIDIIRGLQYLDDDLVSDASDKPENKRGRIAASGGGAGAPNPQKPDGGGRVKVKARIIGICAIVCAVAITLIVLFATGVFNMKQIPVYQGMEISTAQTSTSTENKSAVKDYYGDYNGRNDNVDRDNPFGNSGSFEEEVESTLKITASEEIYYADLNEDIYITINFYNPSEYEIISFVINGKRYQTTMFEYGSDYDKIIIKVNVGSAPGILEYAISEIKYIDGTTIKDVEIDGDTVVTCGVRSSGSMVTASVSSLEITLDTISFTANINDVYELISFSGGYVKAVLYDGESILQTKDLSLGSNEVAFTNLTPNTLYQFAVVALFDDLSGTGTALNYLYDNAVYTQAVVLFDNVSIGQESVSFGYTWYESYSAATITKLVLTQNGNSVELSASGLSAENLLSDTEYTLTAYYTGINGATESISLTFTTLAKEAPAAEISIVECTTDSLTFDIEYTDTDGVGAITAIGLYEGETLVQTYSDLTEKQVTFTNLSSYTQYTIKVEYAYDLNNGEGVQTAAAQYSAYTDPYIEFNSISFLNNGAISEGDSIVLQISMNNPDGVEYSSAVINGVSYEASGLSTKSSLIIEIVYNGQFAGGDVELVITQITCTIDGNTYIVNISENNSATIFIYGELVIESFDIVRLNEGKYEATDYGFASEQLYYRITFSNATKYTIDSVTINNTVYSSGDITQSSDYQTVIIKLNDYYVGSTTYTMTLLNYSYGSFAFVKSDEIYAYYIRLSSDDIVEITTADQLLSLDTGYKYYKLMNDLDLSGYIWANLDNSMYGVFDGNGHTISNIGSVATYTNTSLSLGLFSSAQGVIKNLNITNMIYIITLNVTNNSESYSAAAGGLAASGSVMSIENVNVVISVSLTCSEKVDVMFGGLMGSGGSKTENVTVEAVFSCSLGNNTGWAAIGGLYGTGGAAINNATVSLKVNFSAEDGWLYVGGLVGNNYADTISNAVVTSSITITRTSEFDVQIGGVVGSNSGAAPKINFYNVKADTVVNTNMNLNYGAFATDERSCYIDDTCSGTITVNTPDGTTIIKKPDNT